MKLQIADAIRDQAGTGEARLPGYGGAVGLLLVRADKEHGLPAVGFHHCAVFLIPRDLKPAASATARMGAYSRASP